MQRVDGHHDFLCVLIERSIKEADLVHELDMTLHGPFFAIPAQALERGAEGTMILTLQSVGCMRRVKGGRGRP